MDRSLLKEALIKLLAGVLLVALLLFLPAGSLHWANGRLLMAILFLPMFCAGLVMLKKDPELLRRRLKAKENESEQQTVIRLSGLMFLASFVIAGLNFRFSWIRMPFWACAAAAAVFLLAYLLFAEVLRENSYLSRTVEVQEGQSLVDTGLYGHVRHPMYTATVFLFLSMPLVLGSPVSFLIMLAYLPLIAARIRSEEQVLAEGLAGYRDYMERVKWRLVPHIW